MSNVAQMKCPSCGGRMIYDVNKQKMVCEYCRSEIDITQKTEKTEENKNAEAKTNAEEKTNAELQHGNVDLKIEKFDFNSLKDKASDINAEALPVYHCDSCGAEIIAAPEQLSLTCPYCRNNVVLTDKVSGNLRPDGIVPFIITSDKLPGLLKTFYKDKKLLPFKFFSESTLGNITGVYVPFWVFNGKLSGRLGFDTHNTSTSYDGSYKVTTTDKYEAKRDVELEFKDLPVDASSVVDEALMDTIEPYDLSDVKEFDIRYLSGFAADRFDVAPKDMAQRTENLMKTSADKIVERDAFGYDSAKHTTGNLKADLDAKYYLLPAYLFNVNFAGKDYSFAVNGQTGKVSGTVPTGGLASVVYFLIRMLAVLAVVLLIVLVLYLMGR